MKMRTSYLACLLLFVSGFTMLYSASDTKKAESIMKQVQKKYQRIKSLQADFEQSFKWELAGETQEVKGVIYLQEGNHYRIETDTQLIVTDGKTLWTYSQPDQQVIIDLLNHSAENPLPKDILFQYSEEYKPVAMHDETLNHQKTYMIELTPKDKDTFITSMNIWIEKDNLFTVKVEQTDINGNVNSYLIRDIKENPVLDAGLFSFKIPQNTEVIDLRENGE